MKTQGVFYYHHRFSVAAMMVAGQKGHKEDLDKNINLILTVLPEGTEMLSMESAMPSGVTIDTIVVFRNPLMADVSEIEILTTRKAVMVDGVLRQFNRFDGIKYLPESTPDSYGRDQEV